MLPFNYAITSGNDIIILYSILGNITGQILYHMIFCTFSLHWIKLIIDIDNNYMIILSIPLCIIITLFKIIVNDIVVYDNNQLKYNFNIIKIIMIWTFDYAGFYFGTIANNKLVNSKIDGLEKKMDSKIDGLEKKMDILIDIISRLDENHNEYYSLYDGPIKKQSNDNESLDNYEKSNDNSYNIIYNTNEFSNVIRRRTPYIIKD